MPKVTFVNEQRTVEAKPGQTLLEVAEENGINVFRGLFQGLHCKRVHGWCNRCKVWANPLATGALNEKTGAEKRRLRLGGAVPPSGTMRLACQAVVSGDCEVRTRAGFTPPRPSLQWDADPRPSKWRERWEHRNDEADEDEDKPKKKAAPPAATAAVGGGKEPGA